MKETLRAKFLSAIQEERALRRDLITHPLYFDGDLSPWTAFHARFADEFEEILEKWGWPGLSFLGWEEASAAAEVVRGCWSQPAFMRRVMPRLEQGFRFGEAAGDWFARHYDTVMFLEGKPQVWGTFLLWGDEKTLVPVPIVEPENVDARRKALLMHSLEESLAIRLEECGWFDEKAPIDREAYRVSLERWATEVGWDRSGKISRRTS